MHLTFFLTKKFIQNRKNSRNFSLFSIITIIGIAIGVATLIITLSILNGFEKIITNKLTNLNSHIEVIGFSENLLPDYQKNHLIIEKTLNSSYKNIYPTISKLSVISHNNIKEGITLKGISNDYLKNNLSIYKNEGNFIFDTTHSFNKNKPLEIIIGRSLANKILAELGDEITIFTLKKNEIPSENNFPIINKFKIIGIFESGMAKYDDAFAYINFNLAKNLFDLYNEISTFEIQLNNITKIDSLAEVLQDNLRYPYYVRTVFQTNKNIFTWIELQKKPIPIVLGLIIIVAVFNIISTMLMLVLEKTTEIGVLKSLGLKNKSIVKIFLLQGIFISFIGVLLGNILAYVLSKIQLEFNIIKLPASIYFVSNVPILLEINNFLLVSGITFIIAILISIIPSSLASRINPITTLRFN